MYPSHAYWSRRLASPRLPTAARTARTVTGAHSCCTAASLALTSAPSPDLALPFELALTCAPKPGLAQASAVPDLAQRSAVPDLALKEVSMPDLALKELTVSEVALTSAPVLRVEPMRVLERSETAAAMAAWNAVSAEVDSSSGGSPTDLLPITPCLFGESCRAKKQQC